MMKMEAISFVTTQPGRFILSTTTCHSWSIKRLRQQGLTIMKLKVLLTILVRLQGDNNAFHKTTGARRR